MGGRSRGVIEHNDSSAERTCPHDSPSGRMLIPTYATHFVVEYSRPPHEHAPSAGGGPRRCFFVHSFNVGLAHRPSCEVWAAEAASRAEATFAGSGSSHAAAPPRLAYARELGLPPPLQLVVVGNSELPFENASTEQPLPLLAFSGEDPAAYAAAYAHYHGHGDADREMIKEAVEAGPLCCTAH